MQWREFMNNHVFAFLEGSLLQKMQGAMSQRIKEVVSGEELEKMMSGGCRKLGRILLVCWFMSWSHMFDSCFPVRKQLEPNPKLFASLLVELRSSERRRDWKAKRS